MGSTDLAIRAKHTRPEYPKVCQHLMPRHLCAYCVKYVQVPELGDLPAGITLGDADNLGPPPHAKQIPNWGGPKQVPAFGFTGKKRKKLMPILIPYSMQYGWHSRVDPERVDAKLSAIAYDWVSKTATRHKQPIPDHEDREDIAQTGLVYFMEWWLEQPADIQERALVDDMRDLCREVGRAFQEYRKASFHKLDTTPIDAETGLMYGPLETWAEKDSYKPMLAILLAAKEAVDNDTASTYQRRIVKAWELFDPEFAGYVTRDLKNSPLDETERKTLLRVRESTNPDDVTKVKVTYKGEAIESTGKAPVGWPT